MSKSGHELMHDQEQISLQKFLKRKLVRMHCRVVLWFLVIAAILVVASGCENDVECPFRMKCIEGSCGVGN